MHWPHLSRRVLVLAVAALVTITTVALVDDHHTEQARSEANERAAQYDLGKEIDRRRRAMSASTESARESATSLHLLLAESVRGSDRGADEIARDREQQLERLRASADELEQVAGLPHPRGAQVLAAADTAPALDRLDAVGDQAQTVAAHLHETADTTERWTDSALGLAAAAERFTSRELPSTDDPDALAERWDVEAEDLAGYRELAVEARDDDGFEEIAAAHLRLVDGLIEVAEEAADLLEAGEVDAYNELLEARLGDEDPFGFGEALDEAVEQAATHGPLAETADARRRCLALLGQLDELRATDPLRGPVV